MRAPASDEAGSNQVAQRSARRPPVAVVVTHFNSRLGQRVEWQHPRDFVTEGVEFKVQHDHTLCPASARACTTLCWCKCPQLAWKMRPLRLLRLPDLHLHHCVPVTTGHAERLRHV